MVKSLKPKLEKQDFSVILSRPIESLELSIRSYSVLKNEGIKYVGDLVIRQEGELLKLPNFGKKSLREIKEMLSELELHLGMGTAWPSSRRKVGELVQNLKSNLREQKPSPFLILSLKRLNLSVRSYNALENAGIEYVKDLVIRQEEELLRLPYFGKKSLREVKEMLSELGLHLGMDITWSLKSRQMEASVGGLKNGSFKEENFGKGKWFEKLFYRLSFFFKR